MLIRNINTKVVHEVPEGTRYPSQFFERVTKEQLETEKAQELATESDTKRTKKAKTAKRSSGKKKPARKTTRGKKTTRAKK